MVAREGFLDEEVLAIIEKRRSGVENDPKFRAKIPEARESIRKGKGIRIEK